MSDIFEDELKGIEELEKPETKAPEPKAQAPEPQPKDQPEPDPEGDETEETVELNNKGRFVRHGAFHAEREQRKEWQRKAQEIEARYAADMAKANERLAQIAQSAQQANAFKPVQAPTPQIPSLEEDPIGHFQARLAQEEAKRTEIERKIQGSETRTQQQAQLQQIGAEVDRLEREYTQKNPDYPKAQEYLFNTWANEAKVLGISPDEAVRFYSMQLVQRAAAQNKNPAELAYEFAKTRGYSQAQAQQPQAQTQRQPNLDTIQKGIAASKSASSAPGKAPPGTPTIEELLRMDEDEFAAKYGDRQNSAWQKDMEKLMGLR
jgi:hypothetical protein